MAERQSPAETFFITLVFVIAILTLSLVYTVTYYQYPKLIPVSQNIYAELPDLGTTNKTQEVFTPNCTKLLNGDSQEIRLTQEMLYTESRPVLSDEDILDMTRSCSQFIVQRGYPTRPASYEEAMFPIAFIVTVHRGSEQVERLLRSIYAPQNLYCIHIDIKASFSFVQAITAITTCFSNVFLASRPVDVLYGGFSRLLADIHCMEDLLHNPQPWKYVVNICGQEMPLMTNFEMVQALKKLNGTNDIAGFPPHEAHVVTRYTRVHTIKTVSGILKPVPTNQIKPPPPENMTILHGSAYNLFSRQFVHFVLNDPLPVALLEWFSDTYSPDEHFWPSLQFHKGTPGGKMKPSWGSVARAIKWKQLAPRNYPHCQGYYQRSVCVYGVGDLQWLNQKHVFIANKFDLAFDHVVVSCLEYQQEKKVQQQIRNYNDQRTEKPMSILYQSFDSH